ncbi:ATP-binding protein [Streptomyces sp. NPDC005805]|uniref:ATP-binding protein n=1 Tax=Streptomyces sp. NPDC005805 TaxID=3157068 RepID=UPI0033E240D8
MTETTLGTEIALAVDSAAQRASAAFDGQQDCVASARDAVTGALAVMAMALRAALPDRLVGDVQLVVSELVTNAVKYAPGPCLVDVELDDSGVTVAVWDSGTALPTVHPADPGRIGQHGLEIVMALCEGFAVRREPVGKRITVRLAARPA